MPPDSFARPRPRAGRSFVACAGLVALATALSAQPAAAFRFMNYNLLNFSGVSGAARLDYHRAIVRGIQPDLIVTQEMIDEAGMILYRDQVLNFREPGQWSSGPFVNGPDTDNSLFYRTAMFDLIDAVEVPTALRNASRYHLKLDGYDGPGSDFYVYSFHLKASSGSTNAALRHAEMQIIRADAETLPAGSHILFCGDYNVYAGSEPAFQHALSSQGADIGRMKDPINQVGNWSSNLAYAPYHTQSPRTLQFGGGATGGMDDRFDFILESYNWDDGQRWELLEHTYTAYGNDGDHCCNTAIDGPLTSNPGGGPQNLAVGLAQADSIEQASDHLPVFADISVPARIDVAITSHDFGTVIVGAVATVDLPVGNTAPVPGDSLDYAFLPAAAFAVPAGSFALAPGAGAVHVIGMPTATPGPRDETIGIMSDAPNGAPHEIALSGVVIDHAQPSADSTVVVLADTLDFGTQESGGFSDRTAFVHNVGFGELVATLQVTAAAIAGGDGRFTLAEPFVPALVGFDPAAYDVTFDDTGATAESLYSATLTFETADDPALPGATARPPVAYTLLARVSTPLVGVDPVAPPARTLLFVPVPNPVIAARATLRFDLARAGRVHVAVYDVRGRHVATLLDEERAAGRHSLGWNGRDAAGKPLGNGVYFARMSAPGEGVTSDRRFVLLR
jgi:endonuclease/exonuclease/phosphatase family metal-dependent hydrolase